MTLRSTPTRRLATITVALATVAAACGGSDDAADEPADDTVAETSAADPVETDPPAEEPVDTDAPADEPEEETTEEPAEETEATGDAVAATIGIANIAPVAALELVNSGFTDGMAECAAVDATLDYRNAEGDGSQLAPIVAEFPDSDVDLILAISTPVLQATVAANEADGRGTPVLFGAVTDPFAAGAAAGPDDKPEWLTGWQADAPVTGMFDIAGAGMHIMTGALGPMVEMPPQQPVTASFGQLGSVTTTWGHTPD